MPLSRIVIERLGSLVGRDPARRRYLVAVSGGRDSCALLDALSRALPAACLAVAHFNHALRGADSDGDERHVRGLAEALRLAFTSARGTGQRSSEAALRNERRAFLEKARRELGCDFIVTAHHLEDQLETFLMRCLRGAGVDGLGAMAPRRGRWLRPLLDERGTVIAAYVRERALVFREDESNATDRYLRNRVRHGVLPALESLGEGDAMPRLARSLGELRWAAGALAGMTDAHYGRLAVETTFWTRIDREGFRSLDAGWQARVARKALCRLGAEPPGRRALERALAAIAEKHRAVELPGARVLVSCGHVFFQSPGHLAALARGVTLRRDGNVVRSRELGLVLAAGPESLAGSWRFFRPGDRQGGRKLKEIFLDERIPLPERALVPLLARARSSEVVWRLGESTGSLHLIKIAFPFSFLPRIPASFT